MAVKAFENKEVNKIILTRPAVEAGEKLGFLPGDLQSKIDPYLRPLYDALYEMMEHGYFSVNGTLVTEENMDDWYKITLYRLIEISKRVAGKYSRSKVRKALPEDYAYIIEELITEKADLTDKESYYNEIVNTIINKREFKYN